ncbi:hypothetical protein [Streptomyces sp. AgN23]|uniref:hypothetical protein n=1 Tax=Streptomyces sp. AgN23 TaxID=1188315 RepID=UPI001B3222A8|nr:hypothetical protein [Streptomyces sp. AgN23]QTI90518.1 hypothetical protein AS97_60475 [Streptomyces sp. AgN23]
MPPEDQAVTVDSAEEESPEPPAGKLTDAEPPAPSVEGPGTPVAPEGEMPPEDQASIKAGPHYRMYTDDSDNGGWVEFFTVGDEVRMGDRASDGRGVEIDVWNESSDPDSYEFGWYKGRGKGKWQYSKASMGQPWNMAEGDCSKFRIRLVDNGNVVPSSTDYAQWWNRNGAGQGGNCDSVE